MQRLDEIVETMEGERLALDDMVRHYEEGINLVRQCRRQIDQARQRVERVNQLLEGNQGEVLSDFEVANASEEEAEGGESVPTRAEDEGGRNARRLGRKSAGGAKGAADGEDEIRLF